MAEFLASNLIYAGLMSLTAFACEFALAKPNVLLKRKMPALIAGAIVLAVIAIRSGYDFPVVVLGGFALGLLIRKAFPAPRTEVNRSQ